MDLREYAELNYIKIFLRIFEKTNSMKSIPIKQDLIKSLNTSRTKSLAPANYF